MSALFESLGLGRSDAGVMVNEKQAMRLTTAYACIKVSDSLLASTRELKKYFDRSYAYVGSLKPKPTTRKKKD
jgi:hypothetical protein